MGADPPSDPDDDQPADEYGENKYLKAIHHPDRKERVQAAHQWLNEEQSKSHERLTEIEDEDGSIPDGKQAQQWAYEKGRLDGLRTVGGLIGQRMVTVMMDDDETGDAAGDPTPD